MYGGDGLARVGGKVVLAPFLLPGERARVTVRRETSSLVRAQLLEVVTPSAQRVEPPCRVFARCGGCHYQHAGYQYQLEQKRAILGEVLRRVGKLTPPEIGVVAGPAWQYRNRTQLHMRGGRIGYYEAGSHRLCPVERCPISSPRINEVLAALRRMIPQPRFPDFIRSLELFTNEDQVQVNILETTGRRVARTFFEWCASQIPGAGVSALDYSAMGDVFRVSHRSFFQVSRFLVDRLVETAIEGAEGETAVDLYAGVGLFSLALARRFERVMAVESGSSAAGDLAFNAERAGLAVEIHRTTAEQFLESCETPPEFLLADPLRSGLGKAMVRQLLRVKPRRLAIVSCEASTLARDLSALLAGGYGLERLTLVDLFPQTYHIETVAHLQDSGAGARHICG